MVINSYVFHPEMEDWVGVEISGAKVVSEEDRCNGGTHVKLRQKRAMPSQFSCGNRNGFVLCLGGATSYGFMFLGCP
ncbi:unnamed protein product [Linum trigynum]|uniref:Uncharacterized protein n=1 Tax=Linum trigynum TaxID=586398 RepID=A0AAV2E9L9_9ROSI